MKISKIESDAIWKLKGVAIFSVICAHCSVVPAGEIAAYFYHVLQNIGSVGVGAFFWASGYFFNLNMPIREFCISRFRKLIIPWIIASIVVWLYTALRKGGISLDAWFHFFLGYNSIFYFMTNLMIIQSIAVIAKKLFQRTFFMMIVIAASEVAIICESQQWSIFPTPYLNFMCFIGYFAVGMICTRYNSVLWEKIYNPPLPLVILLIFMLGSLFSCGKISYFAGPETLILELMYIYTVLVLCIRFNWRTVVDCGCNSFFIYLWHIPIVSVVSYICNRNYITNAACIMWPIIVIVVMHGLVHLLQARLGRNRLSTMAGHIGLKI